MSDTIVTIIKNILDSSSAQAVFITDDDEQVYLDCIFKKDEAPLFYLVFPPDKLPDNLALDKNCYLSFKTTSPPIIITAKTEKLINDRTIYLKALKAVDPTSLREYFRVDMSTRLIASYEPLTKKDQDTGWEITGETIDVSGTGVLALFDEKPKNENNINLLLHLNYYNDSIACKARVIRTRKLRKNRYRVAFHIEDIASKDRDKIITCCLHEQRKILRERMEG